jgi:glycolate oxidase iron-sulfur subunit
MTSAQAEPVPIRFVTDPAAFNYDVLFNCMRCGLCLPHCPTFALTGLETHSPRGRLQLMRAVSEGRLAIGEGFADTMTMCLGCLACQSACPAGVQYGQALEEAREQVEAYQKARRSGLAERFINWLVGRVLYGPHGLEPFAPFLRLYQRTGLQRLNLARILPGHMGRWERMMPRLTRRSIHRELGEIVPAATPVRGRVGLLTGCLENTLLANMGQATARVLARNGFEVVIPKKQVCCGALPNHIGRTEQAREQARQNIEVFEAAGVEVVISDAAGCSAQLKEYEHLLADDPAYAERARQFAAKARDVTEFLAGHLPLRDGLQPLRLRVTYDEPCHLVHAQKISAQPRQLIRAIPGVEFVELPEATWCCGSAGTYNLTHVSESAALLERKMNHIRRAAPDVLVTANTGCYIQLAAGMRESGLDIEVLHIVELIDRAYGGNGAG